MPAGSFHGRYAQQDEHMVVPVQGVVDEGRVPLVQFVRLEAPYDHSDFLVLHGFLPSQKHPQAVISPFDLQVLEFL